jgi:mannose-6-phosphate isomerase-like protein (cupin superfamily)
MRLAHAVPIALAFAAGLVASPIARRFAADAHAQTAQASALAPMLIDIAALKDADLSATAAPDLRSRGLVTTEHGTLAMQTGNIAKHFHDTADEIQYIVEGRGSAWLGDRKVELRPGLLLVIPRGTHHAGSTASEGRFKALAIKLPPQAPNDTHFVERP